MVSVVGFFMVSVVTGKRFCFMVSVAGSLVDSAAAGGSISLERIERFLVFLGLVSVVGLYYGFRYAFVWFPLRFCYGFRRWIFDGFCRCRRITIFETYRAIPRFLCF